MCNRIGIIGSGVMLLLALVACVETATMYHMNLVFPELVVAITEGTPHADSWQTFDLNIDYEAVLQNNQFKISGQARLGEHQRSLYSRIDDLDVLIFFLDNNARVLETAYLLRTKSNNPDDFLTFSQAYQVPAATVAFGFGYDGSVSEKDSIMSFYKLPLRKQ